MRVLPGPTRSNTVLAWSPDSRFLAAGGSGDGVTVWEVDAGTPGRLHFRSAHGGKLMRFCPRTGRLYVAFQTGGFWHWNPATDEELSHAWAAGYYTPSGMALSEDGRELVVYCYLQATALSRRLRRGLTGFAVADDETMAEAWSLRDERWVDAITFRSGTGDLFGLRRRPSESLPSDELWFEWIRPKSGQGVGSFLLPPDWGRVTRWVLSPEGERVAWLTDRGLFLCRLDAPDQRLELPAADGEVRRGLAFHPNGRTLAYTTGNTVRLLDADTFAELRAHDWNTGKARAVCFSPDGLRCAASGEGGRGWVTVFDVE
jgi:WD40 repeat protein